MNTHSKKFFEVVRLVSKIFLGAYSKIFLNAPPTKLFDAYSAVLNIFLGVDFEKKTKIMNTPLEKIL